VPAAPRPNWLPGAVVESPALRLTRPVPDPSHDPTRRPISPAASSRAQALLTAVARPTPLHGRSTLPATDTRRSPSVRPPAGPRCRSDPRVDLRRGREPPSHTRHTWPVPDQGRDEIAGGPLTCAAATGDCLCRWAEVAHRDLRESGRRGAQFKRSLAETANGSSFAPRNESFATRLSRSPTRLLPAVPTRRNRRGLARPAPRARVRAREVTPLDITRRCR